MGKYSVYRASFGETEHHLASPKISAISGGPNINLPALRKSHPPC
jgi:hypothetical protein